MTRQKKEIMKKMDEIEEFIAVDMELGCGFAPPNAYDDLYTRIWLLHEELARLSHYGSAMEKMMDTRGCPAACEALPFQ